MSESPALFEVLAEAQQLGLLGPRPLEEHVAAVRPLAPLIPARGRTADIGAGGGIPGLVLAEQDTTRPWVLVDRRQRSCDFLARAVARLGIGDRVEVVCADVTEAARLPNWRGSFDAVVSRGFARPAVMLECASPLLRVGGVVLSTAREDDTEWPGEDGLLERLGLEVVRDTGTRVVRAARQVIPCPSQFPRRRLSTS